MNTRCCIVLLIIFASCRVIIDGETQPASQPTHVAESLPEKTFEVFWQTFEDHYAFFDIRGVDWQKTYDTFRPMVNGSTSEDSLFNILCAMVKPLQDDHVEIYYIKKRSYQEFTASKSSPFLHEFPGANGLKNFWRMVDHTLIENGFHQPVDFGPKENGIPLFTFSASASAGYIRFTRCNVSGETQNDQAKDAMRAGKLLDSILVKLGPKEKIILDIRANEGGFDEFAYAIASRFADTTHIGHYKQKRNGGYADFTPLVPHYIKPQGVQHLKPVFILTNDQSASAADVFAMIMNALPNTTLVGEHTTGIFSDMFGFMLPNGWLASLSNERYFSHDMKCYESLGVPVDIEIRNTRKDLVTKRDPVLEKALEL